MKDFDVIVIGSGIGGLICAGILTSKGLKILLVERRTTPGGYLASFKRGRFIFDSGVDCISGVGSGGLIFKVLESLGVENDLDFIKVNPIRVSIFPDKYVAVDADINAYIDRLMALFQSEVKAIKDFFEITEKVYSKIQSITNTLISANLEHKKISPEVLKLTDIPYSKLLDNYISDYKLKAILSDRCPFIGLPPSNVSALSMVNMIMSYFKLGAYRVKGGFQKLADTLIKGIQKNGGNVLLGNGAKKILLDSHKNCYGIRCGNGEEYTSRFIVANSDFNHTFNDLLSEEYAHIARETIKNPGVSTSFFVVYMGVNGRIETNSSIGYFPSYDIEKYFLADAAFRNDSKKGREYYS